MLSRDREVRAILYRHHWQSLRLGAYGRGYQPRPAAYLAAFGKRLDEKQLQHIADSSLCENTMRLKVLLDELICFGNFELLDQHIDYYLQSTDTEDFYQRLIPEVEKELETLLPFGYAPLYNNIGLAYYHTQRYEEALQAQLKSLQILHEAYGDFHGDTLLAVNNLGLTYDALGEYDKAIELFREAIVTGLQIYGEQHGQMVLYYQNLANSLLETEQYDEAIDYFSKSLEININIYGDLHPNTILIKQNLGWAFYETGKTAEGEQMIQDASDSYFSINLDNSRNAEFCYFNLARIYDDTGRTADAISHYEKALSIYVSLIGEDCQHVIDIRLFLSDALIKVGQPDKALQQLQKAREAAKAVCPDDEMLLQTIEEKIRSISNC